MADMRGSLFRKMLASVLVVSTLAGYSQRCLAFPKPPSPGADIESGQKTYQHANGLRVALPAAYRARMLPNGFIIERVDNDHRRFPVWISVNLLTESPEIATDRMTRLGPARRIRYAVTDLEGGGSGGTEYKLVAVEYAGGRWIQYSEQAQEEWGEPSFAVWDIARNVSLTRP